MPSGNPEPQALAERLEQAFEAHHARMFRAAYRVTGASADAEAMTRERSRATSCLHVHVRAAARRRRL